MFWFGAKQIVAGNLSNHAFFVVIYVSFALSDSWYKILMILRWKSIVFSSSQIAAIWQHAPDISSAGSAARDVNKLLVSVPNIDAESKTGFNPKVVSGKIILDNVEFQYPTRPGVQVLRGLNLEVEPGTYVALVGASGCGKSTMWAA